MVVAKACKIIKLPPGRKAIGNKWVYKIKRNSDGTVVRFKAQLVAQGFTQRKGLDFHETFAPVARMTSQRLVIAIAALEGLDLFTIDVNNAYLNGLIDTKLFMKQPQGFIHPQFTDTITWVCELNKSLYGLKQAGHIWHAALHAYIVELGFIKASQDQCVYIIAQGGTRLVIAVHVDDFLVAATNKGFEWLCQQLQRRFTIKSQPVDMCLGMKIEKIPTGYVFLTKKKK